MIFGGIIFVLMLAFSPFKNHGVTIDLHNENKEIVIILNHKKIDFLWLNVVKKNSFCAFRRGV